MRIKALYKYKRDDGGISVSPNKPDGEYVENYRIIADEGKFVTQDGVNKFQVVDSETADGWYEVEAPNDTEVEE